MMDTIEEVPGHGPVTLEHLIALNDEIVALTRSGMPLERGLLDLGSDLPGRLRAIALALGERMSRGESLPEALAASGAEVPPVYEAVVEAGLRSGRLPIALEGLSTFARGYLEARRSIGLALWYPLLVLTLAYGLFLFIVTTVIPRFLVGVPVAGRTGACVDACPSRPGRERLVLGAGLPGRFSCCSWARGRRLGVPPA